MNTVDLRQAIVNRVKGKSEAELSEVIAESIGADERALPGLGVLLEFMWVQLNAEEKQRLVGALHQELAHHEKMTVAPTR